MFVWFIILPTYNYSKSLVRARQDARFPSHESWRQVLFGSHPRHIVMADSTAVQLADIRVSLLSVWLYDKILNIPLHVTCMLTINTVDKLPIGLTHQILNWIMCIELHVHEYVLIMIICVLSSCTYFPIKYTVSICVCTGYVCLMHVPQFHDSYSHRNSSFIS